MTRTPESHFRDPSYLRINARRLEHLASLGLDLSNKRVLELGSGVGDLTTFWIDRGCRVHCVDARPECLGVAAREWAEWAKYMEVDSSRVTFEQMDLEAINGRLPGGFYDVVFCYGLLYHLGNPKSMLDHAAATVKTNGVFLLETQVQDGGGSNIVVKPEPKEAASQSYSGLGCRPSKHWLECQIGSRFACMYEPIEPPHHHEFFRVADFVGPSCNRTGRVVMIASHEQLPIHLVESPPNALIPNQHPTLRCVEGP